MIKKLGLLSSLVMMTAAMFMTGCNGGGGVYVGPDPYYDGYVDYVYWDPYYGWVHDPYGPYLDPGCYYCYDSDGTSTPKDLTKLSAEKQMHIVQLGAEKLQTKLGLSADRSMQLAKLALQMAKTPKSSLTKADYNSFAKEILGSSADDIAAAQGDSAKMDQLIDRAAAVNGIGPEHARQIMNLFN